VTKVQSFFLKNQVLFETQEAEKRKKRRKMADLKVISIYWVDHDNY